MYSISIMPSALKELQTILKVFSLKIISAIDKLAENPRPPGVKKLKGKQETFYRIRTGDYRVIYLIEDEIQVVEVTRIGHRKDIYK